jgi:hypothetical protein
MSLLSSSVFDSLTSTEKQNVNIELIDGVYVPLRDKDTDKATGVAKIGNIHNEGIARANSVGDDRIFRNGMGEKEEGFDFKDVLRVKQHTDDKMLKDMNARHLVLNDTPATRIFIGGASILGLYVLYNLLYKKK